MPVGAGAQAKIKALMPQPSPVWWTGLRNADGAAMAPSFQPGWHSQVCARAGKLEEAAGWQSWYRLARICTASCQANPGTSAGESPLHQGRVSARLTGLRQRAASALELTQRSAGK